MNIKDLLERAATPGDMAAVCGGYGALFLVDAYSWFGGVPNADCLTAGAVGASIGFATKRLIDSLTCIGQARRRLRRFARFVATCDGLDQQVTDDVSQQLQLLVADRSLSDAQLQTHLLQLQALVHQVPPQVTAEAGASTHPQPRQERILQPST